MPCDTVRTIKTDLSKSNWDRLATIFAEEGYVVSRTETTMRVSKNYSGQYFVLRKDSEEVDHNFSKYGNEADRIESVMMRFKRLYAQKTITDGAKRFGMRVLSKTENAEKKTMHLKLGR